MNHFIARTSNGLAVYIDLIRSPASRQVSRQPRILDMARQVISQSAIDSAVVRIESDMGRPVGYNYVVKTSETDTIFYARLLHEDVYTRFVKNGTPLATRYLSLILHRNPDGDYQLHEIWLGRLRPALPGHAEANDSSLTFWATHAFVLDSQTVQSRTVTREWPYATPVVNARPGPLPEPGRVPR